MEQNKREREENFKTDFHARAVAWLKGMNKDLEKLGDALGSVAKSEDKEVKHQWKTKLGQHHKDLITFRKNFEKTVARGATFSKAEVEQAERMVSNMRRDVKAWGKIKDLYLPEEDEDEGKD